MRQIIRRAGFPMAIAAAMACSMAAAPTAHADAGAGAIRLSTDVPVLAVSHFPDSPADPVFQFGLVGNALSIFGPIPIVGAAFGYQLIDAIVIGARVGLGFATFDFGFGGSGFDVGVVTFLPFFEYLFLDGEIRPFVGAQAGFQAFFPDSQDGEGTFVGGGLGGVHIFAAPGFSISPTLFFDFVYRGQDERAGFDLILAVSFEGWIGGQTSGRQAPRTTTADTLP